MPRFGINVSLEAVDAAMWSDAMGGVVVVLAKAVFVVRTERKRKSCVSSERSTSNAFELVEWVFELGSECVKEGSSSSKSAILAYWPTFGWSRVERLLQVVLRERDGPNGIDTTLDLYYPLHTRVVCIASWRTISFLSRILIVITLRH